MVIGINNHWDWPSAAAIVVTNIDLMMMSKSDCLI